MADHPEVLNFFLEKPEADTSGWEFWKNRSVLTALFAVSLGKKEKKIKPQT